MVAVLNAVQGFFDNYGDPRTKDWFLMHNPLPTALICATYVFTVKVAGPRFMANRKPMELRNILIAYNLFQVIFSSWLFYELGISGWLTGRYNFRCEPVDYSNHPMTLRMVNVCWWYYFSKFTEFMDTIFFVLRKKDRHISTLHVIHHGVMPMSVWFGVKFTPGGHSTFFGLLNTFVHIIMYSYYLLAALGPNVQKYLWWKKYLTTLQMLQFLAIMLHAFQLLFIDCNYPKAFVWWIGMHAVMFFFLFKEFYKQQYTKPSKPSAGAQSRPSANGSSKSSNGYSKQSDYYINSNGLSRPDLVHRTTAGSH
ncbi:elongation of very long chain fatty acids protein AAEL008004-like isoform X1 [Metopolophium dirhodum]|uniref:elongation of very long chain fatty acids protein AAEL008004-like isoform X1 n=1 Tax=Metopolophium dirhodum TaxID=44670 RepID=UPI00298FA6CF|nr:elongation of very long chain fatty acids protein AAEL008004-like isoform X1 [Metopolophium dirhodum]XP_060881205.1 elongation of very long chain fatty acids protein AAEL008004-like isoform X1 [Metopolophium dirhodum]XP_060881206.1 elongation of very long chain fatty acids protein AAEL008004-like isoform X1 [Metopolophium dirhodum]XP_060881207.1 elongation of very long chain fatty acids protein AAEL008004-like isoform X1 [Metopolophium dirhodum]XP_060881208.1 elongation of very long chain fa